MKATCAAATLLTNAELPPDVTLTERDFCDLEMLLMGAFAPLQGYLTCDDFCSVVSSGQLVSGAVWTIPIVLPVPKCHVRLLENAAPPQTLKLRDCFGSVVANLVVQDVYEPSIDAVCQHVLGTTDDRHPYVEYLLRNHRESVYVGGTVQQVAGVQRFDFRDFRQTPAQVREAMRGFDCVVGFQTRNPMHRSHFELTVQALHKVQESNPGKRVHLLLSPTCGPTQDGDVQYCVRMKCYKKLLPFYAERGVSHVSLVLLPLAMRMAGPREAIWHALVRKNFGCTHFIVGRDHAGPSTRQKDGTPFYGPYEAHEALQRVQDKIGIAPVYGMNMVYLGAPENRFVEEDSVAQSGAVVQTISGTRLRSLLENRENIPDWYSFPPVVEELQKVYRKRSQQGFCLYFTGLPCSGKSTLASCIEARLQERDNEARQVTVLDADVIRTHLSKGLGFSREDRQCNVRRIGFVASTVAHHGGICLVANIAPYEEDRQHNRNLVTGMSGGYIEVHVSTPLSVCEKRDVKDLYKKARAGNLPKFTGVSDPYEIPHRPELTVDSSDDLEGKVKLIMEYLTTNGWLA